MRSTSRSLSTGFSLLEMVVAIAILSLSLGALYQSVSGATRNIRADEKYAYAVELARSVLASNIRVPAAGVRSSGETEGGFKWTAVAEPLTVGAPVLEPGALQQIAVSVSWEDGPRQRRVELHSVVEGIVAREQP